MVDPAGQRVFVTGTASAAFILCQTVTRQRHAWRQFHRFNGFAGCRCRGNHRPDESPINDLFINGRRRYVTKSIPSVPDDGRQRIQLQFQRGLDRDIDFNDPVWGIPAINFVVCKVGTGTFRRVVQSTRCDHCWHSGVYDWDFIKRIPNKAGFGLSHVNSTTRAAAGRCRSLAR